jgi:hypothetical protein
VEDSVSRDAESGTRRAFDQKVPGGPELNFSSYDCVHKNADPSSPIVSCQEPSTMTLLQNVAAIPGAIGYAETSDVAQFGNASIQSVEIDGLGADIGAVGNGPGHYRFWTVEYLYSYGSRGLHPLHAQLRGQGHPAQPGLHPVQ